MKCNLRSFIAFILLPLSYNAQIQITSGIAPANLVQNVLIGNGVSTSNVIFTGNPNQIGQFNGVNSTIGLMGGIVISTGDVTSIPTPDPSTDFLGDGDPDLLALAQSVSTNPQAVDITNTWDLAALDFDFIPQGDSVSFDFVFASEEYLAYVNTPFNDVFGFFLSGPGIIGPYNSPIGFPDGAINLATVPGTNLPITISTIYPPEDYDFDGMIDPGFNEQYYINNPTDSTHGLNGFTTSLSIGFNVICGETYHFRFAVADCSDGVLDTEVFFEAGSFESPEIVASLHTETGDSVMIEGCANAYITITRPNYLSSDSLQLNYTLQGAATEGVDYFFQPNQILFLPGQDTVLLEIVSSNDWVTESPESVVLTINASSSCGTPILVDTLFIMDPPMGSFSANLTVGCATLPLTFSNSSNNANNFLWNFGNGTQIATNNLNEQFHSFDSNSEVMLIASYDNFCPDTSLLEITVFQPPTIEVNAPFICKGDTALLVASGANNYTWNPSSGIVNSIGDSLLVNPTSTSTYTVSGTDTNGCVASETTTISVEIVEVIVNNDTICASLASDMASLVASGALTYMWTPANGLNTTSGANVFAQPAESTSYIVTGISSSGCSDTATALVTVIPDFTLNVNSDSICSGESVTLHVSGAESYSWSPGTFLNSIEGNEVITTPSQSITYTIVGETAGCVKTTTSTIVVYPSPYASISASSIELSLPETSVFLTALQQGNENSWYSNNELISNQYSFFYTLPEQPGVYEFSLMAINTYGCIDSSSLKIHLKEDLIFYIPNAFTPDGDEYNNQFLPLLTSGIDLSSYHLTIFNRWGELIFESYDVATGWDGTYHGELCKNGIYTWVVSFKSKYSDKNYEFNGHVSILE